MRSKNHEKLIRTLLNQTHPINSNALSLEIGVSVRTIKTYVKEINDTMPDCITSNSHGYLIDQRSGTLLLGHVESDTQTNDERVTYLIRQLVRTPIDTYELCDQLFVSMPTLQRDLVKVKKKIAPFDLKIINKRDFLSMVGTETNKRRLCSSILYQESDINFIDLEAIQYHFEDIDITYIKSIIISTLHAHHYFINDYSLINLILHITITIDRLKNENTSSYEPNTMLITPDELRLVKEIIKPLEEKFHISYSENDIYELAILFISRATSLNYKKINPENIYEYIEPTVLALVEKLINAVNSYYYINLEEVEFKIRFALHIKHLLIRGVNQRFSKNPLTDDIKSNCPLIYDAAVHLSGIIKEETGIAINDDEIAYIAFHIGSGLQTQKKLHDKIIVLLCCPNYYDLNPRLVENLNHHFGEDIIIKDIINDLEGLRDVDVDLMISTIPANYFLSCELIQVSMFFNQADQLNLAERINLIKGRKMKTQFHDQLTQLFSKNLFEINDILRTQNEVIHHMCQHLINLDYVDHTFFEKIIEREKMSSTAYNHFAIPHTLKMDAKQTGISIMICKNPIAWDKHRIQLILMMCFNKNERYLFNQIFEPITMILNDSKNIDKLLRCKDLEQFIKEMTDCLRV